MSGKLARSKKEYTERRYPVVACGCWSRSVVTIIVDKPMCQKCLTKHKRKCTRLFNKILSGRW